MFLIQIRRTDLISEIILPLYDDAIDKIRYNLTQISLGQKPALVSIGYLTEAQFKIINDERIILGRHEIEKNEIVFIGRHIYQSRAGDGYTIDDIIEQISSSLSEASIVNITVKMTSIQNLEARQDRYGNFVKDMAVFEATAKKPRIELFSVIPKGDYNKPQNRKSPP